jgi:ketosteroid isomerase-like protein
MDQGAMLRLFRTHREAEAARDFDAILATFAEDCFLDTVALGLRSQGRAAARAAYEGYFTAFPDLTPDDEGYAFGDNTVLTWERSAAPAAGTGSASPHQAGRSRSGSSTSRRSEMGSWRARVSTSTSLRYASRPACRSTN